MMNLRFLLIIVITILTNKVSSSSSTSNSGGGGSYTSITALDKYGSSPQIRNAHASSQLYGATTIVAIALGGDQNHDDNNKKENANDESIIIVSTERTKPGVLPNYDHDNNPYSVINGSKVQIVSKETNQISALIGSGLKSDIYFLTNLLRKHSSNYWARYDSIPDIQHLSHITSQILLRFMGYDIESEIGFGGSLENVLMDSNGELMQIGRPFAVSLLLIHVGGADGNINSKADIQAIEPSGMVSESLVARAIGRQSDMANQLLRQRWNANLNEREVEEMCIGILREVKTSTDTTTVATEGGGGGGGDGGVGKKEGGQIDNEDYIVCEILNKRGLKAMKRIPFVSR